MFDIGKVYNRKKDLHKNYGGNQQGGISSCTDHPIIFIFSGSSGKQHGYEDGWDQDNYFNYTGEGQKGDMQFKRGNKAIRDHVKNGKSIYLFESHSSSNWKYIDELELVDYKYFNTPDTDGNTRQGIKFRFKSLSGTSTNDKGGERKSFNYNKPNHTERQGLVTSRVGQGWYRKAIMERWDNKCAASGCDICTILIASHIVPWKNSDDSERLDVDNGLLLSPTYDALFDKYLITFNTAGNIIISNLLSTNLSYLGITGRERITNLSNGNKKYLKKHNEIFYEKHKVGSQHIL